MIDNDYLAGFSSFKRDKGEIDYFDYRYGACAWLIKYHQKEAEVSNFIITDVFDDVEKIKKYKKYLVRDFNVDENNFHLFRIVLDEKERERRIERRNSDDKEYQLSEGKKVHTIQEKYSSEMGFVINQGESEKSDVVSEKIIQSIFSV